MWEALARGWENFMARSSEPLNLRFIIQPAVAFIIALIAGLKDVKKGHSPYLWAMFTNSSYRRDLLQEGWKEMCIPFLVSLILDAIYQLITHQSIYLFELLFTAFFLALLPYLVFRGLVNRIARLFIFKVADDATKEEAKQNKNINKKKR